jgi:hypothetical protein
MDAETYQSIDFGLVLSPPSTLPLPSSLSSRRVRHSVHWAFCPLYYTKQAHYSRASCIVCPGETIEMTSYSSSTRNMAEGV